MLTTNFDKFNESEETTWVAGNSTSRMTLIYPPKPGNITDQFLKFIFDNPGCTKKEFYDSIERDLTPGNNSQLFAALRDAVLVELVGNKYYIGANYGIWTQGKLKNDGNMRNSWHANFLPMTKTGNYKSVGEGKNTEEEIRE